MSEIINPHEQLEMAAEAAGYLGDLDEESGERAWLCMHCNAEDWDPRKSVEDSTMLMLALGLLIEVDREAQTVTAVIDGSYPVEHVVMTESFADGRTEMEAYMMAITRAAAEIGWWKVVQKGGA